MIPAWVNEYKDLKFDKFVFDCWSLARLIYKDRRGIILDPYREMYKDADDLSHIRSAAEIEKIKWIRIEKTQRPEVLDIALFSFFKLPCHVGVVVDPRRKQMIHCQKEVNTVIEDYSEPFWWRKLNGFFRYPI